MAGHRIYVPGVANPGFTAIADALQLSRAQSQEKLFMDLLRNAIDTANKLGLDGKRVSEAQIMNDPASAVRGEREVTIAFKTVRLLYSWEDNRSEAS